MRKRISPKHQRLMILLLAMLSAGAGVALILNRFTESIVYFYSPSEIVEKKIEPHRVFRVGGLVETGSLQIDTKTHAVRFMLTDQKKSMSIHYQGLLPNLFREGQGVIAEGMLETDGSMNASTILAKHDERYMPPEVAKALKKSGRWKESEGVK